MLRNDHHWLNKTRIGRTLLFAFLVAVVLFLAAAAYEGLRALTGWPAWLLIVIALPTGLFVFISWTKAHETNGFDGILLDSASEDQNGSGPSATQFSEVWD